MSGELQQTIFGDFYEQCVKKLYPLCYRITEDHADAEDAISQGFISAMNQPDKVPQDVEERIIWLKRICINKSIDIVRRRRPGRFVALTDAEEGDDRPSPLDKVSVEGANPEELYAWKELLQLSFGSLEPDERKAIALVYEDGLPRREAAGVMDADASYFYYFLARAEKKIHKFMMEQAQGQNSAAGMLLTFWDRSASPEVRARRRAAPRSIGL